MSRSGRAWDALGSSARLWVRCVPTARRLRLVSRHPPRPRAAVTCPRRWCHRHPASPEGAFLHFRSSANMWRQAAAPLRLHHGSAAGPRPSSCPRDTRGPPWCPGRLRRCSSRDPGVAARSSGTSRPRVSRPHFRSVNTRVSARGLFFFFFGLFHRCLVREHRTHRAGLVFWLDRSFETNKYINLILVPPGA